jgi:hypothetical protein
MLSSVLKDRNLDDDALIALMVSNPILIERPIVLIGNRPRLVGLRRRCWRSSDPSSETPFVIAGSTRRPRAACSEPVAWVPGSKAGHGDGRREF